MKFFEIGETVRPDGITDEVWASHQATVNRYRYPSGELVKKRAQIAIRGLTEEARERAEFEAKVTQATEDTADVSTFDEAASTPEITAMAGVEVATVDITE